jgi:hypothetical protein
MGIMWGCVIAAAITFPLVFGWMSFESVPGSIGIYRVIPFGFPTVTMPYDSFPAFMMFHGLVWAAFLTMGGVILAMRRRMRDKGAAAAEIFSEDFLPLILLFSVSLTGLLLTVSYTWLKGSGYEFLSILHAVTVIFTLLWLPFGKFFHIFQRPAQLGVEFYKDVAARSELAHCARCGHGFASRMHIDDLKKVEHQLGFRYDVEGIDGFTHYQARRLPALPPRHVFACSREIAGRRPLARSQRAGRDAVLRESWLAGRSSWLGRYQQFSSLRKGGFHAGTGKYFRTFLSDLRTACVEGNWGSPRPRFCPGPGRQNVG